MASLPQIRSLIRAQPFLPFLLKLADGRQFVVAHPEFVAMQPKSLNVVVFSDDDAAHYIDVPNIIEVKVLPEGVALTPPKADGNGA